MDPKQRRLRLRKSTLRKLDPETASRARGGVVFTGGTCFPCLSLIRVCETEQVTCLCESDDTFCYVCDSVNNTACHDCWTERPDVCTIDPCP